MKSIIKKHNKYHVRISYNGKRHLKIFDNLKDAKQYRDNLILSISDKSLPGEQWKEIEGFSKYQASNLGRIRSKNYKSSGIIKVLKPSISKDGYLQTALLNDLGKYKSIKVHRIIALAFLGYSELEVNHIDGVKDNNNIINLEYVTRSENCQHSFDIGLQKPKRGELNGMAKLTKEQVEEARYLKKTKGRFWGRNQLAKQFGVSPKHLQKIVNSSTLW